MNKIIETEHLNLKPTDVEDAVFFLALLNSPKWKKYIGDRNIKNKEDAEYIVEYNAIHSA